jgi:hypothetical protein
MFEKVMDKYDVAWWVVFEDYMHEVDALIVEALGVEALDSAEYDDWYTEMAEDL